MTTGPTDVTGRSDVDDEGLERNPRRVSVEEIGHLTVPLDLTIKSKVHTRIAGPT